MMQNNKPLISVVTVVYNGAEFLEDTITSVINQTYDNIEYIIIDGGSTDGTLDIIRKYEDNITYWISEPDKGMYEAIDKGFKVAKGEILAWLNADDIYYSGTLNIVSKVFKNQYIQWLTGVPSLINKDGEIIAVEHPKHYFRYFISKGYYRGDCLGFIQQESTFFRNKLYKKKPLDISLKLAGDYKLWIDFSESTKLYTVKTTLASFRVRPGQKSSDINAYYAECSKINKAIKINFLKYFLKPLSILFNNKLIKLHNIDD